MVLMSLRFEKLLSPDATVTGIVSQMWSLIEMCWGKRHTVCFCASIAIADEVFYFLPKEADFVMHQALLLT